MSDFTEKDISKNYYGHEEYVLTDEDIEKLKAGKELFADFDGEYSFSLKYKNVAFDRLIPDGATNKDVFKAVFGYDPATDSVVCNKEDWCGASEPCHYCMSNPDNIGKEEDWWNALYKEVEKCYM